MRRRSVWDRLDVFFFAPCGPVATFLDRLTVAWALFAFVVLATTLVVATVMALSPAPRSYDLVEVHNGQAYVRDTLTWEDCAVEAYTLGLECVPHE